jgi:hypothetical protein
MPLARARGIALFIENKAWPIYFMAFLCAILEVDKPTRPYLSSGSRVSIVLLFAICVLQTLLATDCAARWLAFWCNL